MNQGRGRRKTPSSNFRCLAVNGQVRPSAAAIVAGENNGYVRVQNHSRSGLEGTAIAGPLLANHYLVGLCDPPYEVMEASVYPVAQAPESASAPGAIHGQVAR